MTLASVVLLWPRLRPRGKHRTAGALLLESASGLRSPDLFDTLVHSEYGPLMINKCLNKKRHSGGDAVT